VLGPNWTPRPPTCARRVGRVLVPRSCSAACGVIRQLVKADAEESMIMISATGVCPPARHPSLRR